MRRIVVHIDHLVLRGFRHEDRHAIADGLRQELARWLAEPASAARLANLSGVSRLKLGKVHIERGTRARQVGMEAARGIARGLKP